MVLNFINVVARNVYKIKFQEWDIAHHLVLRALSNRYFITKRTVQSKIITSVKKKKLAAMVRARGVGSAVVRRGKLDPVPVTQLSEGENRSFARPTSQLWEEYPYILASLCVGEKEKILSTLVYWSWPFAISFNPPAIS